MGELIDGVKDVTEFLGDALEACKDHSLIEAIAQSAPWWINGLAEGLAESLPVVGFLPSCAANHFEPAASAPESLPQAFTLQSPLPPSSVGEGQGEGLRTCRVVVHGVKSKLTRMAHKTSHRNVTIELPLEDRQRLDHVAANSRRSKNAILLQWLQPRIAKFKPRSAAQAER